MTPEELLTRLGRASREEPLTGFDVADSVVRRLHARRLDVSRPLAIMAGISATAAVIVQALALKAWFAWQNPIAQLLWETSGVTR
ncbi:MAG: hypothetical protein JXQ73_31415 [Phycisphaerae bacterium]|nr:hypothetical protein [Phycisphaerae bacterium]